MQQHECGLIESKAFPGPFVRVRGRLSRENLVRWSPALRVEKGDPAAQGEDQRPPGTAPRVAIVAGQEQYWVDFLDYNGKILVTGPARLRFLAREQQHAPFVARLPYDEHTQTIQLRRGEQVLGRTSVPTDRPYFTLMSPGEDAGINPSGVLHLRWAPHDSEYPMTFYVRYSHDAGSNWVRPGVNLTETDYYLDLREMPGGKRCVVQVIGTNGYRTSYVQTRYFEVPVKPPEAFLSDATGPMLFAQGFSRQEGALENLVWLIDGGAAQRRGGSLDARTLGPGVHQISLQIRDQAGQECTCVVGNYDARTGRRVSGLPL